VILRKLTLRSFRAHADTEVEFTEKINGVCGPNGAGKTNLLEAIHFACLTKSFLTTTDSVALRQGDPYFEVKANFAAAGKPETRVRLAFVPSEGKRVMINGNPVGRLSEVVGRLPVVVVFPGDQAITSGGPDERRRLVDNILSQAHPAYFADLMAYRRALRQRNALLRTLAGRRGTGDTQLASWTDECVRLGGRLVARRDRFMRDFSGFLDRAYHTLESVSEEPSIRYRTLVAGERRQNEGTIRTEYRQRFSEAADRELVQGRTLVGPHRDEFLFYLDGLEVRRYASQGQHRTFVLALKLAQYLYIQDAVADAPVFLLDDTLDNLDAARRSAVLKLLESDSVGQSIITAADERVFSPAADFDSRRNRLIRVEAGRILEAVR